MSKHNSAFKFNDDPLFENEEEVRAEIQNLTTLHGIYDIEAKSLSDMPGANNDTYYKNDSKKPKTKEHIFSRAEQTIHMLESLKKGVQDDLLNILTDAQKSGILPKEYTT